MKGIFAKCVKKRQYKDFYKNKYFVIFRVELLTYNTYTFA